MTEKLKPCPFCGGKAGIQSAFGQHKVICLSCGVVSETHDEKEKAIEVWNSRPIEDEKDAEIARLRDALDTIVGLFEINGGFWAVAEKMHETAKQALEKGENE